MRIWFAGLMAVFVMTAAQAQERLPAIEQTIQSQIDAFLVDDFDTAFTYASPNIRQYFGTSERFGQMVQDGFPMVWRPTGVEFLEQRQKGPYWIQNVLFRDASGVPHLMEYTMIKTDTGWQIDGVRPLVDAAIGA